MLSDNTKRFLSTKIPSANDRRDFGACGRTRTGDLRITNALLYQLSHASNCTKLATLPYVSLDSITRFFSLVNIFLKYSLTFFYCSI